jgi:6-phosphogluconolactonase
MRKHHGAHCIAKVRRSLSQGDLEHFMRCGRCIVLPVAALGLILILAYPAVAKDKEFLLYAGTYTGFKYISHGNPVSGSHSEGIYVSHFRPATGELTAAQLAARINNPSFLAVSPDHRVLYAASEDPLSVGPARDHESYVSAYAIDHKTGRLRLLNSVPSGGTSTCYLSVDKTGKYVLTASFGSGSISILRVKKDGSLGEQAAFVQHIGHSGNQTQAHPSSNDVSPDNHFVSVADLGLDKVLIYHFDPTTGALSPLEPAFAALPAGSGPRHIIFDAAGKHAYLMNELTDVVSVYAWDPAQGTLTSLQDVSTELPDYVGSNHTAEIAISPNGKFLYQSNRRLRKDDVRGPDTIGVFAIDPEKGTLTPVEQAPTGGIMPRSFAIDLAGKYLLAANEVTNNIVVFSIDETTGKLSKTGKEIRVDTPVCLQFVPTR